MQLEFIKFILTIIATTLTCYKCFEKELDRKVDKLENEKKYDNLLKEIDKKVDKILYDRELEFIKRALTENSENLSSKLEILGEDMKIIKEFLLLNNRD